MIEPLVLIFDLEKFIETKINQKHISDQKALFLLEKPYALELIQIARAWLQHPVDPKTGKEILAALRDKKIITDKYKVIWATTDKTSYNLFKTVYEKIKWLEREEEID